MSLWQNTLIVDNLSPEGEKFKKYERRIDYSEPTMLASMLNTPIEGVHGNDKFSFYVTESGQIYSIGFDFRHAKKEELYGIPR